MNEINGYMIMIRNGSFTCNFDSIFPRNTKVIFVFKITLRTIDFALQSQRFGHSKCQCKGTH